MDHENFIFQSPQGSFNAGNTTITATLSTPLEYRDHRPRRKCIELLPRDVYLTKLPVCVYNIFLSRCLLTVKLSYSR